MNDNKLIDILAKHNIMIKLDCGVDFNGTNESDFLDNIESGDVDNALIDDLALHFSIDFGDEDICELLANRLFDEL